MQNKFIHFFTSQQRAYMGLTLMTIIIGLSFIFVKIGLRHSSAIDLLAHRFTAGAILIIFLRVFGLIQFSRFTWTKVKPLLLLSLFYPLLFFSFQTFGMQYSTVSQAGIIFATVPIITLIVASLFLHERTTPLQKLGIALSVAGIIYITLHTNHVLQNTTTAGYVLLFISVFSIVAYYTFGKKISVHFSTTDMTVWMTFLAFVVFNAWSVIDHLQRGSLTAFFTPLANFEFLWSILYLGLLSSVVTSYLSNFALRNVPASQIAVFNNVSPVIAIIGGVLLMNETLQLHQVIGGILVIAGVLLTQQTTSLKIKTHSKKTKR